MAFISNQTMPSSTFKILSQAFTLITKNFTLILPILFLSFLVSFTTALISLSFKTLITDLTSKVITITSLDPESPEYASIHEAIVQDLKQFFGLEAIFTIPSFILSSLIAIATIHALSGKISNLKDLSHRVCRELKGPMVTQLYVCLLSLGYTLLLLAIVGVCILVARASVVTSVLSGILAFLGWLLLSLYLGMLWSVSLVVSVVEDGCYGHKAISKASEIVKGRRKQGALLLFLIGMVMSLLFQAFSFTKVSMNDSKVLELATEVVNVGVGVAMALFAQAVILVFYYDCKRSKGEAEGWFMYAPVPSTEALDNAAYL